jgi:FkbH-like protein
MTHGAGRLGFLGARKALEAASGRPIALTLGASGEVGDLIPYLRAHLAVAGFKAEVRSWPFGVMGQALRATPGPDPELILLLPWNFVSALDWRSGGPDSAVDVADCFDEALTTAALIARRPHVARLYLPAPTPPIFADPRTGRDLDARLTDLARSLGATIGAPDAFALAPYLATGRPIGGAALEDVAMTLADLAVRSIRGSAPEAAPAKVLVTDLDNTLWRGVVAEDGPDAVGFGPDTSGWPHFIYQRLLKRLRHLGIVLVAVSRNRPQDVLPLLRSGAMPLREDDFVSIVASYEAKSAQIAQIAEALNLDPGSFVFVDDNPIELAEAARALPQLTTLRFPADEADLADVLDRLAGLFARSTTTQEDLNRTDLYRRRIVGLAPSTAAGGDVMDFLRGLDMRLTLRERRWGGHERALQLINKTNQFNLNGRRLEAEALAERLAAGGRLFTGELADRAGSHGEVLALLVSAEGLVESFVMSCRVFLRQAEAAFLLALGDAGVTLRGFDHRPTDRNTPVQAFLANPGFIATQTGALRYDGDAFGDAHATSRDLIRIVWEPAP